MRPALPPHGAGVGANILGTLVAPAAYAGFRQREELLRERELHIRESEELVRVGRKLSALLESLPVGVLVARWS